MNHFAHKFVDDILNNAPNGNKDSVIQYVKSHYDLTLDRKVYYCYNFAVRFSYSRTGTFNNTVLSLSSLQKYDKIPFFVVLIRNNKSNVIYLANSSFISKISHSSRELSMSNIKGSFNGSDIMKTYEGMENIPVNFDDLFALHSGLDWEDNLLRLVEASSAIKPKSQKFEPDTNQKMHLFDSVARAQEFISSDKFVLLNDDLNERCNKCRDAILAASHIENVNLRGRIIEFMITSSDETREKIKNILKSESLLLPEIETHDDLGDYVYEFDAHQVYTDIKTKIVYLDSAPKAYNIDKFLSKMSEVDSSFFFFLIGIDENGVLGTALCSVYHNELIDASFVQHHWAGRATRGVVQFSGKALNLILQREKFVNVIEADKSRKYIEMLLAK